MRNFLLKLVLLVALPLSSPLHATTLSERIESLGANVIFMRHALAPGFGDPDNFDIERCETQRNLDDQGRAQARDIGTKLKATGLDFDEVLSSQWCRCAETADLLDLGNWSTFSGLNSFFQGYAPRELTLEKLDAYLNSLSGSELVVLVTHQVVISAATGISPPSGGIVLYNSKTQRSESWSW